MKYVHKLLVRIIAAVIIGFLLAGVGTKITYSCMPVDGAAGCASFDKAVMHPNDLLNNKQDSLFHLSEAFAITAIVIFAILSIFNSVQKKPKSITQQKG
jgi:hypothetical protein